MLPIFHIVPQNCQDMNEIPIKPRRKKPEVLVHRKHQEEPTKKTFSTNFNSKKCRHKNSEEKYVEEILEVPESDRTGRISKKQLNREIQRLTNENVDIISKFNELEDLSVKKITKLKDRISSLHNINEEIHKENDFIKGQYQELLSDYDTVKNELDLSKYCKNCEDFRIMIEKISSDNNVLRGSNKELTEDINMLKTVVYRLNVQLERYQEKGRQYNIKITKSPETPETLANDNHITNQLSDHHRGHKHSPISWGNVNQHTLGPLLDAYQDTISEKEEIIQSYETEISIFTGKLKGIIEENECLHRQLTEDENCSLKLKEEVDRMRMELISTKEQNDILIKKCALKQDKIEEVLKCYEHKVEQLKRDYNVAQEQFFICRNEVNILKEKNKSLINAQNEFRNEREQYIPISVHQSSVNECKKWYEELKIQYENEKKKLQDNLDSQIIIIKELKGKIGNFNKTKEELEQKLSQMEKHIKKSETKYLELEHTLNEVQLSRSACRKQLHKAMGFAKDMVSEQETLLKALNQKQLENKSVKKIGCDMASRMDSLKSQLKDVQRSAWAEFSTVEQKISEQENVIERMKEEHEVEIDKLKKIIKDQEEKNILLHNNDSLPTPHYLLFKERHN